ncbi:MAG: hypothetical protein ACI9IJ_002079 [Psychromonas sp.]|jgi:hypothetical protein
MKNKYSAGYPFIETTKKINSSIKHLKYQGKNRYPLALELFIQSLLTLK